MPPKYANYIFTGHLHVKFAALVQDKTKFLALDKCLPNRRFLQILDINQESQNKEVKLAYNPKWLAILKSTNHLQSSSYQNQHMPGPGNCFLKNKYFEKNIEKIYKK
jgi:lariat debranching enzyme